MRRIALINQKGGVGKTTTTANLGAALAEAGRRVLLVDLDPQANLSMHLGVEIGAETPSTYGVLVGAHPLAAAVQTLGPNLALVPSHIDLSGAEMELAGAIGRETLLRDALEDWEAAEGREFDYVLIDCPPSLGLLSVNGLIAANEAFVTLQTEFFALQGMSKLVQIVQLLRRRLHPELKITGILPCLYDPRLRLAREVLAEIRRYFPSQVFRTAVRTNVKLAEAPSYGQTIFQYAPESNGARDYREVAREVIAQETGSTYQPPAPDSADPEASGPETGPEPTRATEPLPAPAAAPEAPEVPAGAAERPAAADTAADTAAEGPHADPSPSPGEIEYVLMPGKGLRPVASARDPLAPLPHEAFGAPAPAAQAQANPGDPALP